jgi:hypothetical protein
MGLGLKSDTVKRVYSDYSLLAILSKVREVLCNKFQTSTSGLNTLILYSSAS